LCKTKKIYLRVLAVFLCLIALYPDRAIAGLPNTSYTHSISSNLTTYVSRGKIFVTLSDFSISDGLEYVRWEINVSVSCPYTSGMAEGVADYIYVYGVTSGGSEVYIGNLSGYMWRSPAGSFGGTVFIPPGYARVRLKAYWDSQYMANDGNCYSYWTISGTAYVGGYASTSSEVNAAKASADNAASYALLARNSADTAATNASNAYNSVNNANGNTITAVRDSSGTALAEARLAKTNSLNAYNEAHTANTKLDSLQTTVTNIQNNLGGDTSPPVPKLRTVSGAVATSGGSIQTVLEVSDNVSSTFTYSLDGSLYNPLPVNRIISLPVSSLGPNVISVWVKDQAGNVGITSITIRKI